MLDETVFESLSQTWKAGWQNLPPLALDVNEVAVFNLFAKSCCRDDKDEGRIRSPLSWRLGEWHALGTDVSQIHDGDLCDHAHHYVNNGDLIP